MVPTISYEDFKKKAEENKNKIIAILPSDDKISSIISFSKNDIFYNSKSFKDIHSDTGKELYFFIPGVYSFKKNEDEDGDIIIFDQSEFRGKIGFSGKYFNKFKEEVHNELDLDESKDYILYFDNNILKIATEFNGDFKKAFSSIYLGEKIGFPNDRYDRHVKKLNYNKAKNIGTTILESIPGFQVIRSITEGYDKETTSRLRNFDKYLKK